MSNYSSSPPLLRVAWLLILVVDHSEATFSSSAKTPQATERTEIEAARRCQEHFGDGSEPSGADHRQLINLL